jgi:hypothetical protein
MNYRFSAEIVYNNYQWPLIATAEQRQAIEEAAQAVLDARVKYPVSSLADFYNRSMPPGLVEAQQKLDAAVDAAFSKKKFSSDTDYVAFLFELYQQILPGVIVAPALLEAAAEGLKRPALRRRWGLPKGSGHEGVK